MTSATVRDNGYAGKPYFALAAGSALALLDQVERRVDCGSCGKGTS